MGTPDDEPVHARTGHGVTTLTLDRPPTRNALSGRLIARRVPCDFACEKTPRPVINPAEPSAASKKTTLKLKNELIVRFTRDLPFYVENWARNSGGSV